MSAASSALLDEKARGLQRELASVADEGVFETLVADAAEVRRQLDELDGSSATLAEERATVERAEYDLAAAHRAFAESRDAGRATPTTCAWLAAISRRRREALARIDAELDRAAGRLEQGEHAPRRARRRARRARRATHERIGAGVAASARRDRRRRREAVVRAATAARDAEATRCARAEADAARWQARAETLAAALDAGAQP